jgi:hypothetical protein
MIPNPTTTLIRHVLSPFLGASKDSSVTSHWLISMTTQGDEFWMNFGWSRGSARPVLRNFLRERVATLASQLPSSGSCEICKHTLFPHSTSVFHCVRFFIHRFRALGFEICGTGCIRAMSVGSTPRVSLFEAIKAATMSHKELQTRPCVPTECKS